MDIRVPPNVYHHLYEAFLMTTEVNLNLMEPLDLTISVQNIEGTKECVNNSTGIKLVKSKIG